MSNNGDKKLTKYPSGSRSELWTIGYPLMLSALSGNLMVFLDRMILSWYSVDAMNAAAAVSAAIMAIGYGAMGIASIASVFVGQYNGMKAHSDMGKPCWQMLWFALMTILPFTLLTFYANHIIVPENYYDEGIIYYRWLMLFGPLFPMIGALTAFFVGRGNTRFVMMVTLIGNLTNLFLDIILVFGVADILQPMGIRGAAIATVTAQILQVIILFIAFLSSNNRKEYGTNRWHFHFPEFWKCLKIGVPGAFGHLIVITAWAYMLHLMADTSESHITVFAVCQSALILVAGTTYGLYNGSVSVNANHIGAQRTDVVPKSVKSGVEIVLILGTVLLLPLIVFPEWITLLFLNDLDPASLEKVTTFIRFGLITVWVFFVLDGIAWIFGSVLTAAGDTKFIMITTGLGSWLFGVLPIHISLKYFNASPDLPWLFITLYITVICIAMYIRYRSRRWQSSQVTKAAQEIVDA